MQHDPDKMTHDREMELRGSVKFRDSAPGVQCPEHSAAAVAAVDANVERFAYLSRIHHPAGRSCRG